MPRYFVFVLGMHRSGTSVLASALCACGGSIGEYPLETVEEVNRDGFWEDSRVVSINEALLQEGQAQWYHCNQSAISIASEKTEESICELLLNGYGDHKVVVLKDPRFCITLPLWLKVIKRFRVEIRLCIIERNTQSIVQSLYARDGFPHSFGEKLSKSYKSMLSKTLSESSQIKSCTVSYSELISTPAEVVQSLIHSLRLPLEYNRLAIEAVVDPVLNHHGDSVLTVSHKGDGDIINDLVDAFVARGRALTSLGEEHSYALSVIDERDSQLLEKSTYIKSLGGRLDESLLRVGKLEVEARNFENEFKRLNEEIRGLKLANLNLRRKSADKAVAIKALTSKKDKLLADNQYLSELVSRHESHLLGSIKKVSSCSGELDVAVRRWRQESNVLTEKHGGMYMKNDREGLKVRNEGKLSHNAKPVAIIVPVYTGFEETKSCILSVIDSSALSFADFIVINDCSPDGCLVNWLEQASGRYGFKLLHNKENLGFVATVNRGMSLTSEVDVLLLNSDVEVAEDWLERLQKVAYLNDKVASVTPMSNNATISSFPNFCEDNELLFGRSVDQLHQYFSNNFDENDSYIVPSGVGFCMYMRRDAIDIVGKFDVLNFGRGYGEENDWCHRAEALGLYNYQALNVFAYHKGGVSFAAEQDERKLKAIQKLNQIHPKYEPNVHEFIGVDPGRRSRIKAIWGMVGNSDNSVYLHISHKLGGGVQQHIDELSCVLSDRLVSLLLCPQEDGQSVALYVTDRGKKLRDCLVFNVETDYEDLKTLLKAVGVSRVHFHHLMGVHPKIWSIPNDLECPYDFTVHDYYCVNGNPTLIGEDFQYVDEPDQKKFDKRCFAAYPIPVSGDTWRENHLDLLRGAARIIAPSVDTKRRFRRFFDLDNIIVARHIENWGDKEQCVKVQSVLKASGSRPKVLVLGALSREKGADVLEAVAKITQDCEFHLLGYSYKQLDESVITHGPYEQKNILTKIAEIEPDIIWFPCRWPETYSYTLSAALKSGFPIVASDIGAFSERVADLGNCSLVSWRLSVEQFKELWEVYAASGALPVSSHQVKAAMEEDGQDEFYISSYVCPSESRRSSATLLNGLNLTKYASVIELKKTRSEAVLSLIWSLRNRPVFGKVFRLIPFNLQRKLKRVLSSKPMHDIVN